VDLPPYFFRQLDTLLLTARRSFIGRRQGRHRSSKRGFGLEFAEYRAYEPGDHPRHIDWGVYARTDRLYVRRFVEEQDLSLLIVIDDSASMRNDSQPDKSQFTSLALLALSYVCLGAYDNVRLVTLSGKQSPCFRGPASFGVAQRFIEALDVARPPQSSEILHQLQAAAWLARAPGLCIILSDFLYELETLSQAFAALRSRNLEIHAIQVIDSADFNPFSANSSGAFFSEETAEQVYVGPSDSVSKEFAAIRDLHFRQLEGHCLRARIGFTRTILRPGTAQDEVFPALLKTGLLK
jgi:uncharacterized protein (DUF58 family)